MTKKLSGGELLAIIIIIIVVAIGAGFFEVMRELCTLFFFAFLIGIGGIIFLTILGFKEDAWEEIWGILLLVGIGTLIFFGLHQMSCDIGYSDLANKTIELNEELKYIQELPQQTLQEALTEVELQLFNQVCLNTSPDQCQKALQSTKEGVALLSKLQKIL